MIPRSAASELVPELQELRRSGNFTELDLRRVEREAESVKSKDPAPGYMLLGMIACLKEDIEAVRKHHNASLAAGGEDPVLLSNYATSVAALGYRCEARNIQYRAYTAAPSDHDRVIDYASALVASPRPHDLLQFMNHHEIEYIPLDDVSIRDVETMVHLATERAVSDDDFESAVEYITASMHAHGYYLNHATPRLLRSAQDIWLSYQVTPTSAKTPDELSTLNEALIEKQVDYPQPAFDCSLLIGRFSSI